MAEYKSAYTGEQIDSGIGKANTAVQPADLSAYQELLVSGTNIKTINNTSILGEGNIDIQGGGGEGASIRVIDATNPDDWEGEGPTQSCLIDVLTNVYQVIYIDNVPTEEEGMTAGLTMYLLSKVDIDSEGNEYHVKQYMRFDDGDGEEPAVQTFTFSKEGDNDAEMDVASYDLGGGGDTPSAPIYFKNFASFVDGNDGMVKFSIYEPDLADISNAIDSGKEIVIGVNGPNYEDNKYFRLSDFDRNGRTYISEFDESYYLPDFTINTPYGMFTAEYDSFDSGSNEAVFYRVYEGTKRYTPTGVKVSLNEITFSNDDLTEIWAQKREMFTVNIDENNGENWVEFKKVYQDDINGKILYTSATIPDSANYSKISQYILAIEDNGGNIETSITKNDIELV